MEWSSVSISIPFWLCCRLHNKGFYLQLGLQKMVSKTETRELHRHVTLTVDGNRVELPDIAGLIILNIQSWGAGADPWGTASDPVSQWGGDHLGLGVGAWVYGIVRQEKIRSVDSIHGSSLELVSLCGSRTPGSLSLCKLPHSMYVGMCTCVCEGEGPCHQSDN